MNPDLVSSKWPDSLWQATAVALDDSPALMGPVETEVCIVGAGYTGLSAALHLAEAGVSSVVVERNQPGWGCSGRNGGQVHPNGKSLPGVTWRYAEPDRMDPVVRLTNAACDFVFDLIRRHQIPCAASQSGYVMGIRGDAGRRYIAEWIRRWQAAGPHVDMLDRRRVAEALGTEYYDCGMFDARGGSLQPLSYARGLARACMEQSVALYGNSPVVRFARVGSGWRVDTPRGSVSCKSIVIGTNGYTDSVWPGLRQHLVPVASLISATEPLADHIARQILPGRMPVAETPGGIPSYFRLDESNRMVFGGRGTILGRCGKLDTGALRRKAIRLYPQLAEVNWVYDWGGYVAMTAQQRPLLIRLDRNVYAGFGYNGRGIAIATLMGSQLGLAVAEGKAVLPIEAPRPVPLHWFHPLGIAVRIAKGELTDQLRRRSTDT